MTGFPELFSSLAAPFEPQEVRVRTIAEGHQLHYITARTAMNRLDNVLGPENWWDEYIPGPNSVVCKLTIRMPDGTTVTKADAGGYSKLGDSGDDDKSGFSDSFKRAAAKFGVARYLYRDGVPNFVQQQAPVPVAQMKVNSAPAPSPASMSASAQADPTRGVRAGQPPRTGRALFAWTKKQEEQYGLELIKHLNRWAKFHELDERMVDWNAEQVALAHDEANRKIAAALNGRSEAYEEAISN